VVVTKREDFRWADLAQKPERGEGGNPLGVERLEGGSEPAFSAQKA